MCFPIQGDSQVWVSRPPTVLMLDSLAKYVIYLRELRIVMIEKLLTDFTDGVDVYLSVLRDADDDELERLQVGFDSGVSA